MNRNKKNTGLRYSRKVSQESTSVIADAEGNVQEYSNRKTYAVDVEPPYVKVYFQDICYLSETPRRYAVLLWALIKRMSYAGDQRPMSVVINKGVKEDICKEINWKNATSVDNGLQTLIKSGLIRRTDRGIYQFNPYIFGRGSWNDIVKLQLAVDYDEEGRKFTTNFADQPESDDNGAYFSNTIMGDE